jgi:hypothetical protein
VAKAPADGYTILIGTNSTNAALKYLMKSLPYDQDTAFTPVGFLGSVPLMVAVNNDVPAKTLKEFVDLAKRQARPGERRQRQHLAAGVSGHAGQHGGRDVQQHPVQERPGGHDRPDRRPGDDVHRRLWRDGAPAQGRQDPRPGRHVAASVRPPCPNCPP